MPWCDGCAKYFTPNSVTAGGACPSCGVQLATPRQLRSEVRVMGAGADPGSGSAAEPGAADPDAEEVKVPWHFKLMLVSLSVYLGWRAVQGIVWVVHRL